MCEVVNILVNKIVYFSMYAKVVFSILRTNQGGVDLSAESV